MTGPTPDDDQSVENEPHLRKRFFAEEPAEEPLRALDDSELAEHSVWDEAGLSRDLAGDAPADAATYGRRLQARAAAVTPVGSWTVTLLTAAVAGPLAIVGTLVRGQSSFAAMGGLLGPVVFGPLIEEVMKNAAALWVVESRPHLFRSRSQIAACVLASGAMFAIVENLLYLNVYIPDPTPEMIRWRWTVCVALHMGCALTAGLGTMQIWSRSMATWTRPQLSHGAPYMIVAIVLHGAYNALAVLLETFSF